MILRHTLSDQSSRYFCRIGEKIFEGKKKEKKEKKKGREERKERKERKREKKKKKKTFYEGHFSQSQQPKHEKNSGIFSLEYLQVLDPQSTLKETLLRSSLLFSFLRSSPL